MAGRSPRIINRFEFGGALLEVPDVATANDTAYKNAPEYG